MQNVVFDIGNVICDWDPKRLVADVFDLENDQQLALECVIFHDDWLCLDRGTLSLSQAVERAHQRSGLSCSDLTHLYAQTGPSLRPFRQVVELIEGLHNSGYKLFVLSNIQKHCFEYLIRNYDFWGFFSGFVISSEVQALKPEYEIYRSLLERFALCPELTLFIDDRAENIAAARYMGIQGLQTIEPTQLETTLRQFIVF